MNERIQWYLLYLFLTVWKCLFHTLDARQTGNESAPLINLNFFTSGSVHALGMSFTVPQQHTVMPYGLHCGVFCSYPGFFLILSGHDSPKSSTIFYRKDTGSRPRIVSLYFLTTTLLGIWSHHFMANRWGNSGNSVRLYFLGLPNHCRWWLKPWN